jgi:short-subunit dehydrogenase
VFGYLGDQERAQQDFAESRKIIESNYVGAVSILNVVAEDYHRKGNGVIVGVSSVAGDRGRQSNYVYGSAKAGFTAYLSGLRNRLMKGNVHVMTLKPGFIKTKMVAGLHTPPALTALPDKLATYVYKAIGKKRNVVYYLPLWRYIMTIIVLIPESIFKKLKL